MVCPHPTGALAEDDGEEDEDEDGDVLACDVVCRLIDAMACNMPPDIIFPAVVCALAPVPVRMCACTFVFCLILTCL